MAKKGNGIFLVYVDIDAKHDKEFNDWYNTEHLPELLAVPGILSAARYKAVKGGPNGIEMPERAMAPVLQIGRMSVPSEIGPEWNAWYNGEYIPGYREVPGVIYARRYRVHEGLSKYTTVYEFANTAVPESAEWKHQNQHSSPRSPRMRQAMTHAPGSPGVYTRIDP